MNFKKFINILKTWNYLDLKEDNEYKIYGLGYFLIFILFLLIFPIPFLILNESSHYLGFELGLFLVSSPIILLIGGFCLFVSFIPKLSKIYDMRSNFRIGASYSHFAFLILFLTPGFVCGVLLYSWVLNNILIGIGLSLAFLIPNLVMVKRLHVFNDNSCKLYSCDNNFGIVFGYNPGLYGIFTVLIGLYGYYYGFKALSSYNSFNSSVLVIVWIFCVLIFQLVLMFPDKINNHLPFELRKFSICFGFLIMYLALFIVFISISQFFLLGLNVSIFKYLTIGTVLKWCIYFIIVIIIVKLYLKIFSNKK